MSANVYQFSGYRNLSPGGLFLLIALDQTKIQLGFADLAAVATWLLSVPDVHVPGKMKTATEGTSVMSIFFRSVIKTRFPKRVPTVTLMTLVNGKLLYTRSLGAWIGRFVPVVGLVFMRYDATCIMYRAIRRYNAMVKPEDRFAQ